MSRGHLHQQNIGFVVLMWHNLPKEPQRIVGKHSFLNSAAGRRPFYLLKDGGKYATRITMKLFILLIGMVLILEGLPYVAAPESMQAWLKKISEMRPERLRIMGLTAMAAGLLLCWIIQSDSLF